MKLLTVLLAGCAGLNTAYAQTYFFLDDVDDVVRYSAGAVTTAGGVYAIAPTQQFGTYQKLSEYIFRVFDSGPPSGEYCVEFNVILSQELTLKTVEVPPAPSRGTSLLHCVLEQRVQFPFDSTWTFYEEAKYRRMLNDDWQTDGDDVTVLDQAPLFLTYGFAFAVPGNGAAISGALGADSSVPGVLVMEKGILMDPSIAATYRYPFKFDLTNSSTDRDLFYSSEAPNGWKVVTTMPPGSVTARICYPTQLNKEVAFTLSSTGFTVLSWDIVQGDADLSQEIDAADLDMVTEAFGLSETDPGFLEPLSNDLPALLADVDESGEVDAADVDLVLSNFGLTGDF